jgi:exosortase
MDSAPASRQPTAWRAAGPAVLCALVAVVLWQFFGSAARGYVNTASLFRWWTSQWFDAGAETEHGVIVLAVSAWLLWRNLWSGEWRVPSGQARVASGEWRVASAENPNEIRCGDRNSAFGTWHSALAAMLAGLALHAVGFAAQQARISIVALLIFTWGVLRLGGGRRWGAAAMFPLGFLLFAIPINVLDSAGFWLRMGVVRASAALAHAAGIGVLRNGTQLVAPDGRYQYDVVAACSGVRSLTALAALAALAGYLWFWTWPRRVLMLLLCAPLVYLGNVVRLASIVVAAHLGGPRWGERVHDVMGVGVFLIVLGGLLVAMKVMERWWPEEAEDGGRTTEGGGRTADVGGVTAGTGASLVDARVPSSVLRPLPSAVWAAAAAVTVIAVGEMFFLHHLATMPPRGAAGVVLAADGNNPVELPAFLGTEWAGRRVEVTAVERDILPADTGFSRKNYIALGDPTKQVFVSIVLSGRDRTSIHRPEVCLVGQGWTITGTAEAKFKFPGDVQAGRVFPATLLHVQRSVAGVNGKSRPPVPQLVAYWFVDADVAVATHWARFWRDAWNRVVHARADRWAYVLLQTDAADGEAAARARMQAVLDGTLPVFQRVP